MIRKILFVDDDRVIQIVVEQQLAGFADHFSLVFANDGLDAIKKLENGCFSLVCIDLIMPRMKGANLFAHIRSNFPYMPVIILSGKSKEEMQKQIPPKGVLEYLTKPFDTQVLGKSIMNYLQKEAEGGIMNNVSPPVFFQFMEMEAKTCTARVLDNSSAHGGILYFVEGQLVEAKVGMISGLDAAHVVFGWGDVTVFIENKCPDIEDNINLPLQTVIMQAVSMSDEDEEEGRDRLAGDTYTKLRSTPLREVKNILAGDVKANKVVEMSENVEMTSVVEHISVLGEQAGLGRFHFGAVSHGTEQVILLPSKPPIEISCSPETDAMEIVNTLGGSS
ncbi:response regulator [Desulforhopalus sp. 52FAK]